MSWSAQDIPSQSGRIALVTGAGGGVGFPIALELARRGAEILVPARTLEKSQEVIRRIKSEVTDARLVPGVLDVASLASIRAFANFYEDRFPGQTLDLLINNAGVMGLPQREITMDGFERQFATNYLGPFALTAMLFEHCKPRPGTRIVAVSALIVQSASIDFDNLQSEREYKPMTGTLSQSKLADLIFTIELQRRLSAIGSPISSICAHPGVTLTKNAQRNMTGLNRIIAPLFISLIGQRPAQAALPILFAATASEAEPAGFYGPDGFKELKGYPARAKVPKVALDADVACRLWAETERLTGISFHVT